MGVGVGGREGIYLLAKTQLESEENGERQGDYDYVEAETGSCVS